MAKIKLGNRPKNFKRTVKVQMLDGSEGTIECSYTYRTRTEFGDFIDSIMSDAGVTDAIDEDHKFSLKELMEKTKEKNANYIMNVIDGWNLDVEFSESAVLQLCDELPGAAGAIMETYRMAVTEGRLGN